MLPPAAPRPGPELEQMIRLAHDGFLVLHNQHRVAVIAQPLHHADELAHVARMESDARLIENEERIDQRIAEAGGEIDPLDFAAAQRAGRAIQREIAEADFEEISEPEENSIPQLFDGVVTGRERQFPEEIPGLRERQVVDFGNRQALGREPAQFEIKRLRLKAGAMTNRAAFISAIAGKKDADMHLVSLGFQPLEITLHAVPGFAVLDFLEGLAFARALDDKFLHPRFKIAKRFINRDAFARAILEELFLAFERNGRFATV